MAVSAELSYFLLGRPQLCIFSKWLLSNAALAPEPSSAVSSLFPASLSCVVCAGCVQVRKLTRAAKAGNADQLRELITPGVDVDAIEKSGDATALYLAADK
eukprot:2986648-Pleurochrysis_carterae.AAC.1